MKSIWYRFFVEKNRIGLMIVHLFLFLLSNACELVWSQNAASEISKPGLFFTRSDFTVPTNVLASLKEKFNVTMWPESTLPREKLLENIKGKYALFCYPADKIDKEVIEAAGNSLKIVSTFSVGYDHVDVNELKKRGIKLGYTPDVLTEATSEHAVAILLATSRRVVESYNVISQKNWTAGNWSPAWMNGHGLDGSTVGIVGYGRIGSSIAKKLKAFNIGRLLYNSRSKKADAEQLDGEFKSVDDLVKESDFVVVSIASNEQTKGIISRERINSMKPNAILVNIARGAVVDQVALTEALQNKKIAGAGLDVTSPEPIPLDDPLLKLDNVVITPHIGSATYKSRFAIGELAAKNILAVINGEKLPAEVV